MAHIFLATVLAVSTSVSAYYYGTPNIACDSMFPIGHGFEGQNTTSSYTITLSEQYYSCGDNVTVTLGGSIDFKGFFCQARTDVEDGSSRVGEIGVKNVNISQSRCNEQAITHTNRTLKSSVSFDWMPTGNHGNVTIVCTFVKQFDTYWVKQPSVVMMYREGDFCSAGSMTSVFVGVIISCLATLMFI